MRADRDSPPSARVLVTDEGDVRVVTINRPDVRNAIDIDTAEAIATALDSLDSDPNVRVGVLTGAGGCFSAGMDLKAFARSGTEPILPGKGFAGLTDASVQKPLIAAVEGFAVAGGFEMALACDLVVASDESKFGLPEVTRGLIAGAGGLVRLPGRIPANIAMELALTGALIDARRARDLGLVNALAPKGEALAAALELARSIARNAPLAVVASKKVVRESPRWTANETTLRQEVERSRVASSRDAREGATAFAERRPAQWVGS